MQHYVLESKPDRLTTRSNLRRRNVNIPSVLCPFCEDQEESVEYLFTACIMANKVWSGFSGWCSAPPLFIFDFKDIMEAHNFSNLSNKAKKIIHGLVIITCWCIWKGKSEVIFNESNHDSQDILGEVKSTGFGWLKYRSSFKHIRWVEWCKYSLYML
ncbi:putative reverse transcriptase zinc-binding domain-containing protein [Helianthus anomalus]